MDILKYLSLGSVKAAAVRGDEPSVFSGTTERSPFLLCASVSVGRYTRQKKTVKGLRDCFTF